MIDACELYWAAGFLEGEGSFTAGRASRTKNRVNYTPKITCGQVHRQPLERLERLFGGKIYSCKGGAINTWNLQGQKSIGPMMMLWPHMSPRRQGQITLVFDRWLSNKTRNLKGSANPSAKLSEDQVIEILKSSLSCRKLGKQYGVSFALISHIRNRRAWPEISSAQGYTGL